MRFKEARESDLLMVTPDGQEHSVRPKFERREKGEVKEITPREYAEGKFSPVARRTEVEIIQEEMPYVRVLGFREDGSAYKCAKVSTKYPKDTNSERTPYDEKIRRRRGLQDARQVVCGMGRTVVQEGYRGRPPNPFLYLIPEGHDPASQPEVGSDALHDHLKQLYRATYRKGTRTTFTFTSLQGEDTYSEEHLLTPTREHEYQPKKDSQYPFQRPLTPDEFDHHMDQAKAGQLNAQENRLVEALENIAEAGGQWKVVPVYRMAYGPKIRSYFEPSGKIANNLREDIEMACALKAQGSVDPGWQSGDLITEIEDLADYSILGRVGALHDGYTPMEVVEAEDSYMQLPRVDDALIATSPRSNVMGLVLDKNAVADWHNGTMQSRPLTLDLVAGNVVAEARDQDTAGAGRRGQRWRANAAGTPGVAARAGRPRSERSGDNADFERDQRVRRYASPRIR